MTYNALVSQSCMPEMARIPTPRDTRFYQALLENAPGGIALLEETEPGAWRITYLDAGARRMLGYSVEDVAAVDPSALTHPQDVLRVEELFAGLIANPGVKPTAEYRCRHKDGSYRWIESTFSNMLAEPGVAALVINFRDISERKRAEEEARSSAQRLRTIVENEPECVKVLSREGKVVDMNAAGLQMLEAASLDELRNTNLLDFVSPNHREAFLALHERVMRGESGMLEFEVIGSKGTHRWLETHAVPLFNENHEVEFHLAVTRDVTDRRSLAEQLLQSQKLSSLGTLASGIAHDFNNILAIILGYLPMLQKLRSDPQAFTSTLGSVQVAAERATALVQQLLTFAHKADFRPEAVSVPLMLKEVGTMLTQTFPRSIAIEIRAEEGLPAALFDPNQFHQVMMNLCINARDAMPSGGTLSMSADAVASGRLAGRFPGPLSPEYIRITVQDSGLGMDETTRRRVFEPFFTTKAPGHGTGLGLSVVYSILHQHRGFVEIESASGKGTRLTLYVPTTTGSPSEEPVHPPSTESGTSARILIIEDEPMLREITEAALTAAGYSVLTAANGSEGISCFEAQPSITLVISDLGLPGMSGEEVVKRLLFIRPGIKIIVCSGFVDPAAAVELTSLGIQILQKPYRSSDLLTAVKNALR